MNVSPIALFVYNRPWHTKQTVEALLKNALASQSDLIAFADGAKSATDSPSVSEVREYLKTISGFHSIKIIESEKNQGLANSIISGVTSVLQKYDSVIVMEDDLVTSPYFLTYMQQALSMYDNEEDVISIHGYVYPVKQLPETFFLRGADCWGWATWRRGWALFEPDGRKLLTQLNEDNLISQFDMDDSFSFSKMLSDQIEGKNNSWAVRWHASAFLKNKLTLYPGISFVNNIGLDNSGTHSGSTDTFKTSFRSSGIQLSKIPTEEDRAARKIISRYLKTLNSPFHKIKRKLNAFLFFGK